MSAQARRPSAINRLGLTGAPDKAAEIASPAAPSQQPQAAPEPARREPAVPEAQSGVWRRVVEVEGRKYAAAMRKERARWAELTAVVDQARAAGASDDEIRAGLIAAGAPTHIVDGDKL
jgi:hypothetical protein